METGWNNSHVISILYVEDEQDTRDVLSTSLAIRYPALRLLVAENGGAGLEMFKRHRPDIVITDINMPVMDGISMSAGIRSLDPDTVIIALTAISDAGYLLKAIETGIDQYALKPINQNRLFSIIDASISKIMSAREIRAQHEHIRKLSIAVDKSPITVLITDSQGNIEYVNPTFTILTGFLPEEVIGQNPRIMQSGITPAELYKNLWKTIKVGNVWQGQFQNRKKNGDLYWESVSISPIFDDAGLITHFVALKEDITEWKRLTDELRSAHDDLEERVKERTNELYQTINALHEEIRVRTKVEGALRESREELNQAQRVAGAGSWLLDIRSGRVTWSDELYRIHGFNRNTPIPSYEEHGRIFTADSLAKMRKAVETTLRTGEPHKHDLELIRPDGTKRWVTASGEAVRDKDGTISMLRGISIDITERKQLEQQLVEAKRLEAIGQLAGGLAHEVRNPLNAILSISEALFKEKGVGDNPEYEPYIQHIRTQVKRLAQLMNDLLELGKPIPVATLHPVLLREVCADAIKLLELSGVAKGHRISQVWGEASDLQYVLADGVKLQQVVSNLLENAIQHSPKESEVELQLTLPTPKGLSGNMAVIRISDSGSGIPAGQIDRVFEPFYSTRKGGTGLGLALVRHFMEHMGGQVRIWNNDPPPGCTAEIRIPLAREER